MISHIKKYLSQSYDSSSRKFELTYESMIAFNGLRRRSADLLIEMLSRVRPGFNPEDLVVTGDYKAFAFNHKQHFTRARKELVDAGFIVYEGQDHYVNPVMIGYNSRRQLDFFYKFFGIKKEIAVNLGGFNK